MDKKLFAAVFFLSAAIMGPWAWFHVAPPAPEGGLRLEARTSLKGYRFQPEVLSDKVLGLLSTTNVHNGTFSGQGGRRSMTVFQADWSPGEGSGKTIVNHTPDVCWVNIGWRPIHVGQPDLLTFRVSGKEIPFECRAFESEGRVRELVVWCTLINGEVMGEPLRFRGETKEGGRLVSALNLSRLAIGRFIQRIERRQPSSGYKQFCRFSTRLDGDPKELLDEMGRFASEWLEARPFGFSSVSPGESRDESRGRTVIARHVAPQPAE